MRNLRCRCLCLATAPQPCGEAAGACCPLDRRVRTAKRVSRSAGESVRRVRESGMPSCFCKPPPWGMKMRRWVGIPRLGWGFLMKRDRALRWVGVRAGAPQTRPTNASAWVRTERDQTLRPHRPMTGAINSNHGTGAQQPEGSAPATERCPAGEGLNTPTAERRPAGEGLKHSSRRTGPRKKDLNTPTIGPCYLRRAYHSASAAFPRGPLPFGKDPG